MCIGFSGQVLSVLAACVRELNVNKEKFCNPGPKDDIEILMEEFEMNIITALYLCTIITKLLKVSGGGVGPEDYERSHRLVYMLNQMNLKLRDGQTLLHLAVNGVTPVDDFHTSDVCRFPCVETVKLLLNCGASVDVTDCIRNTPLHTLTATVRVHFFSRLPPSVRPMNLQLIAALLLSFPPNLQLQNFRASDPLEMYNIEEITDMFIDAGVHVDAVNVEGLTAAQICTARKSISFSFAARSPFRCQYSFADD